MYLKKSLDEYLDDLAARLPAPGGGSASALCGALGVALLEMAANFTIGNERYKGIEEDIKKHLISLKEFREGFERLIDEDVKIYSAIRSAFKTKDKKIIDKALKGGYYASLKICKLSKAALEIALALSENSNANLITDVGCGAELLNAAFNSGIFNAEINLKGIEDKSFVKNENIILEDIGKAISVLYKDTIMKTKERMRYNGS